MNRYQIALQHTSKVIPCKLSHNWKMTGGRSCPKGYEDCSQTVYECRDCGRVTYGYGGDLSWEECWIHCTKPSLEADVTEFKFESGYQVFNVMGQTPATGPQNIHVYSGPLYLPQQTSFL
jgi:hypothetical protein